MTLWWYLVVDDMTSSRRRVAHEHRGGELRRLLRAEARARHGRRGAPNARSVALGLGFVPRAPTRRGRFRLGGPESHARASQNARPTRGSERARRAHERRHREERDEERTPPRPRGARLRTRGPHDDSSRAWLEVFEGTRRKRNWLSLGHRTSPSPRAVNTACCARLGRCAASPRPPGSCAGRVSERARWRDPRVPRLWTAARASAPSPFHPRKSSPRPP